MKKIPYIIILVFALIAVLFAGLWVHEKNEKTELTESLCENSIHQSCEHFTTYQKGKSDDDYWYGVAEYNSFIKAYIAL